jgi:hypothetical protein
MSLSKRKPEQRVSKENDTHIRAIRNVGSEDYYKTLHLTYLEAQAKELAERRDLQREANELTVGIIHIAKAAVRESAALRKSATDQSAKLYDSDGKLKRAVTVSTAANVGRVTRRSIEKAIKKGALLSEGKGTQRRIVVESLLKYFPPDKPRTDAN